MIIQRNSASTDFLAGGGEMGSRMRQKDWTSNLLGPPDMWPQSLKTAVRIVLNSRFPMFVWWGRELINLYNDAYIPLLGQRHPSALGQPGPEIWREIWSQVGPQAAIVLNEGKATWNNQALLILERNGYPEEAYFTFSYSPVTDDGGGVGGLFCAVTEDTQHVLAERRLHVLRQLAIHTGDSKTAGEACQRAAEVLGEHSHDVSFSLIYLLTEDGNEAHLSGSSGVEPGTEYAPTIASLAETNGGAGGVWPLSRVTVEKSVTLTDLHSRSLPGGPWPDPAQTVMVLPLVKGGRARLMGFIVAGASPRLPADDSYHGFFELVAGSIASAISNAQEREEERKRAEALAELDRAKTLFFSNVSHEFRTPLTLMLGPIDEILGKPEDRVFPENRDLLAIARRNGQRLLKLVNTLLDFSRIEAGRIQAVYEPMDLALYTAELASVFRSTVEKAGMRLIVDCPPLPERVYVNPDMWEKIVLNLVSNAFKYTLQGEIQVSLRVEDGSAVLSIRDTGVGIPEQELSKIFHRFHRVEGAPARTHEGTGIGLSLVQELARLHGGSVGVQSVFGRGSTFTVSIPLGKGHLPADKVNGASTLAPTTLGAEPFVEEASRWLPDSDSQDSHPFSMAADGGDAVRSSAGATGVTSHVLVADDNADMREYVRRLLAPEYRVTAVADGREALQVAIEQKPDLVLTDVMMPNLDGFGLLSALRSSPGTAAIPVIMVSARAGEEARVEGRLAGADDYLTKPFSARELLARVNGTLAIARIRRESLEALWESEVHRQKYVALVENCTDFIGMANLDGRVVYVNPAGRKLVGIESEEQLARTVVADYVAEDVQRPYAEEVIPKTLQLGHWEGEVQFKHMRTGHLIPMYQTIFLIRYPPDAGPLCLATIARDITQHKRTEAALRESEIRLQLAMESAALGAWQFDPATGIASASERVREIFGASADQAPEEYWFARLHPEDRARVQAEFAAALRGEASYDTEYRIGQGEAVRWVRATGRMLGRPGAPRLIGVAEDVTPRKRVELSLRESEERFRALADNMSQFAWMADEKGWIFWYNRRWYEYTGTTLEEMQGWGWRKVHHPDHVDRVVERIQRSWDTGELWEDTFPLRGRDGQYRWFLSRAVPIRDAAARIVRWFGTNTDVTGQLRTEQELRRANQDMEQFAYSASHDLQEPIRNIVVFAEILRARYAAALDENGTEYLKFITDGARRMEALVKDLLAYTQTTGIGHEAFESIDSEDAFSKAVSNLAEAIRESAAGITRGSLPHVRMYEVHLQQIFQNLIGNAIKYRADAPPKVHVSAVKAEEYWRFAVADNGIGISPRYKETIFGLFKRLHPRDKYSGTGIGLAICQSLIERYGGRIWVESELGKGSTFFFTIPAHAG